MVANDPGVRQCGSNRVAVGVVGVDRDHLDPAANVGGQRGKPALDGAAVATIEHLDHAAAVQVGNHGGQLMAAAVMGLVQRQPARRALALACRESLGAVGEGAGDLVAGGVLLAGDLSVRGAADDALGQPCSEADGHPPTGGKLLVGLGERAPAFGAAVAALSPHQPRRSPGDWQVAHPHPGSLLDVYIGAAAVWAAGGARERLDLQVEPLADLLDSGHDKAIQPDEAGSVVLHPLFPPGSASS